MFTRFRSKPATALAAVLGCALIATSAPAAAQGRQNKEETAKAKPITPSRGFSSTAKKLADAFKKKDHAALAAAAAEGEPLATTSEDKYLLAFYQLQIASQNKDRALQGRSLDTMIDSGLTPADSIAVYNFFSGQFAYGDKNYSKAIQRLEAARAAGSAEPALSPMLMDSYLNAGQVDQGWAIAKAAILADRAAGKGPSEELYVRPAQAFQKANRPNEMFEVLTMRVQDHGSPSVWRNTLYILLQQSGDDKAMSLDILRLMRATGGMKERAEYTEYAALAIEAGYPAEVVALIKEAQSGGILPQGDAHFGSILESQQPRAAADAPMLKADATKPETRSNPRLARATADALVGSGNYADAISLYEAALSGGEPLAQYRLGVAQALAGQSDAAVASLAKVQDSRQKLARLWSVYAIGQAAPAATATPAAPAT